MEESRTQHSVAQNKEATDSESKMGCSCLKTISDTIVNGLETIFFRLGRLIARNPWVVILISLTSVGLCCIGFLRWYEESESKNLWVPVGSPSIKHSDWVSEKFPSSARFNSFLLTADNVLTSGVLKSMLEIDTAVKAINSTDYNWTSICVKRGTECWSNSLLELWSFDANVIKNLTVDDILHKINTVTVSPVYYSAYDVSKVLGDISRNGTGYIVGAKACKMTWAINDVSGSSSSRADTRAFSWEGDFLDVGKKSYSDLTKIYRSSRRSQTEDGGGAITGDLNLLSAGYFLIIIYVIVVLGRFNCVEHRAWLSFAGIIAIGMSLAVGMGLSSAFGMFYGPVHSILPFLLLGIGVDDMFVIIQAWNNLNEEERKLSLELRIGLMMKHAGVSITVTSLTDFVAFAIGATTILPSLQSFCVYVAVSILAVFFYQSTFFVACMTLDEKRKEGGRNACCCCHTHRQFQPVRCSENEPMRAFFEKIYAPILLKLPVKIIAIICTLGLLGVNIYGFINLKQDFDFTWFLPDGSPTLEFTQQNDKYFPIDGVTTAVYLGPIDYYKNGDVLDQIYQRIVGNEYTYEGTPDSWYSNYKGWLNDSSASPAVAPKLNSSTMLPNSEESFYTLLQTYIATLGRRHSGDVKFTNTTGLSYSTIQASRINLKHRNLADAQTEVKAMDSIRLVCDGLNLNDLQCFAYSRFYFNWEGNKVIQNELYRNIGLACACVFVVTLVLIANLWTSIIVFTCVVMTLVDVGGLMYFWGLTIDTVTSVILILAIGLAVDYSAHIGHTFMTMLGSRNERTHHTLIEMGPAVFNGGFSTFLAFVLLAASSSYIFTTFFKVFFGVVIFGLFHGMVYLPVMLSWIGPSPYTSAHEWEQKTANNDFDMDNGSVEKKGVDNKAISTQDEGVSAIKVPLPDYTPELIHYRPTNGNNSSAVFIANDVQHLHTQLPPVNDNVAVFVAPH